MRQVFCLWLGSLSELSLNSWKMMGISNEGLRAAKVKVFGNRIFDGPFPSFFSSPFLSLDGFHNPIIGVRVGPNVSILSLSAQLSTCLGLLGSNT